MVTGIEGVLLTEVADVAFSQLGPLYAMLEDLCRRLGPDEISQVKARMVLLDEVMAETIESAYQVGKGVKTEQHQDMAIQLSN